MGLKRRKTGKAPGPDHLPVEAWKALGGEGVDILWKLINKIFNVEKVPDIWNTKLMSHALKLFARVIEGVKVGRG